MQLTALLASAVLLVAVACQKQATGPTPANTLAALPLTAPAPADNPARPAKTDLSRALFWDPILSGGRDVSCASCHHPATGYADALDLAIGENGRGLGSARHFQAPNTSPFGQRNTQTVLNTAFNGLDATEKIDPAQASMFWDGRAQSLKTQARRPLTTLEEMRGHAYAEGLALDSAVARLRHLPAYVALLQTAFGGAQPVTAITLS